MKFVRLNEYRPKRTAEVLEAIEAFDTLHNLRMELLANSGSGRIITASVVLLRSKIAKIVESAEMDAKTELILSQIADEITQIKRRNPDPKEQRTAISKWLFDDSKGYLTSIWEMLFKEYLPSITRVLMRDVGHNVAEEIATKALSSFMEPKPDSTLIKSLMEFDASKGALLTWLKGGVKTKVQS